MKTTDNNKSYEFYRPNLWSELQMYYAFETGRNLKPFIDRMEYEKCEEVTDPLLKSLLRRAIEGRVLVFELPGSAVHKFEHRDKLIEIDMPYKTDTDLDFEDFTIEIK